MIEEDRSADVDVEDLLRIAQDAASRALRRWPAGLSFDADDVASATLVRLLERRDELGDEVDDLAAYAHGTAKQMVWTMARSEMRRSDREEADVTEWNQGREDDAIARLLAAEASADLVTKAMRYGLQLGDEVGIRVISAWLMLAEELGARPPVGEVADAAEVSHPTVRAAMKRFQAYLRAAS